MTKKGKYVVHKVLKAFHGPALALSYIAHPHPLHTQARLSMNHKHIRDHPPAGLSWKTFTPFRTPFTIDLLWEESLPSAYPPQPNKLVFLNTEYSTGPLAATFVLLTTFSPRGLRTHTLYASEAQLAFGALPCLLWSTGWCYDLCTSSSPYESSAQGQVNFQALSKSRNFEQCPTRQVFYCRDNPEVIQQWGSTFPS